MELAETYVVMGVLAIGNDKKQMIRLINALKDVSKKHFMYLEKRIACPE